MPRGGPTTYRDRRERGLREGYRAVPERSRHACSDRYGGKRRIEVETRLDVFQGRGERRNKLVGRGSKNNFRTSAACPGAASTMALIRFRVKTASVALPSSSHWMRLVRPRSLNRRRWCESLLRSQPIRAARSVICILHLVVRLITQRIQHDSRPTTDHYRVVTGG
jgi:hypothetical protein